MSLTEYAGRDWSLYWSIEDADGNVPDYFADTTYCVSIQNAQTESGEAPDLYGVAEKTGEAGALYNAFSAEATAALPEGNYLIYWQYLDSAGRKKTYATSNLRVFRAPEWKCAEGA